MSVKSFVVLLAGLLSIQAEKVRSGAFQVPGFLGAFLPNFRLKPVTVLSPYHCMSKIYFSVFLATGALTKARLAK